MRKRDLTPRMSSTRAWLSRGSLAALSRWLVHGEQRSLAPIFPTSVRLDCLTCRGLLWPIAVLDGLAPTLLRWQRLVLTHPLNAGDWPSPLQTTAAIGRVAPSAIIPHFIHNLASVGKRLGGRGSRPGERS